MIYFFLGIFTCIMVEFIVAFILYYKWNKELKTTLELMYGGNNNAQRNT